MHKYLILCVDDKTDILNNLLVDLAQLETHFVIEGAHSVSEAKALLASKKNHLALVLCSHMMEQDLGVDFLVYLAEQPNTANSKKILLTASAGLEDTVQAINRANLDYFIAKPWDKDQLLSTIIDQLSDFMIDNHKDLLPWLQVLNTEKLIQAMNKRRHEFSDN